MDSITADPINADDAATRNRFDDATAARDVQALSTIVNNEGPGSLYGKASLAQINNIQSRASEFSDKVKPIDDAGGATTPKGRQQIAQTFASTADHPLYGQALVAYVLGQKEDAYKLFTGGTAKTTIEYANDNGNILQKKTNGLGEPLSIYDTQENRFIPLDEYSRRGGGLSAFAETTAGLNMLENRKLYNAAYQTEKTSLNAWMGAIDSVSPTLKYSMEWLDQHKTDFPPDEWAKLVRNVSNNIGTASNVSKSNTAFDQLNKGARSDKGITVTNEFNAKWGTTFPVGAIVRLDASGTKIQTDKGDMSESLDRLKNKTNTASQSAENSQNSTQTFDSILQSDKFQNVLKGKTAQEKQLFLQQLQQVLRYSNEIGTTLAKTVDDHGKPSFISLPTTTSFNDPQALLMTQLAQHRYNQDQIRSYKNYFDQNAQMYDQTKTLPVPGAISAAFTKSNKYLNNKITYGKQIDDILSRDFQAKNQSPDVVPPSAVDSMLIPAATVPSAAVPPREAMSPAAAADRTVPAAVPASALPPVPAAAPAAAAAPPSAPPTAPEAAAAKLPTPKAGDRRVFEGKTYKFKGGDPNKQSNWTEVK